MLASCPCLYRRGAFILEKKRTNALEYWNDWSGERDSRISFGGRSCTGFYDSWKYESTGKDLAQWSGISCIWRTTGMSLPGNGGRILRCGCRDFNNIKKKFVVYWFYCIKEKRSKNGCQRDEKWGTWQKSCQGTWIQKYGSILCEDERRSSEESTGTDSKGKYDQYGRFSFGERVRSDRCSLFRWLCILWQR